MLWNDHSQLQSGFLVLAIPTVIRSRRVSRGDLLQATSIGALLGTFRASHLGLQYLLPTNMQRTRKGLAGALSMLVALSIDDSAKNSTFIIWLIVRAIRCVIPTVKHGPLILMCLTAAQILSTWIRAPHQLSPSYLRFLNHQGGKSTILLKHYQSEHPVPYPCSYCHPGFSCGSHAPVFFLEGIYRALPVYLPIHLLSFLAAKQRNPLRFLFNLLRSCTFLSLYCTVAWASACVYFNLFPGVTRIGLLLCTWMSGLALALEAPGRQKELATYCAAHALDSIYRLLKLKMHISPRNWISNLALTASFSIIMHHHQQQPAFLMKYLFGIQNQNSSNNPKEKKTQISKD